MLRPTGMLLRNTVNKSLYRFDRVHSKVKLKVTDINICLPAYAAVEPHRDWHTRLHYVDVRLCPSMTLSGVAVRLCTIQALQLTNSALEGLLYYDHYKTRTESCV